LSWKRAIEDRCTYKSIAIWWCDYYSWKERQARAVDLTNERATGAQGKHPRKTLQWQYHPQIDELMTDLVDKELNES
jgi:hypothetical protein